MKDTLFVQFYNRTRSGWFDLSNGFSDTWDLCRDRGDICWISHLSDSRDWYDPKAYEEIPLPLDRGRVYVSAVYISHLYQVYLWAKAYPEVEFIVGGPVTAERPGPAHQWNPVHFNLESPLPSNIIPTGQSLEQLWGLPDFSGSWHLELPEEVPADQPVYFSYTLDNYCYWRKCPFCSIACHDPAHIRHRKACDLDFMHLDHPGRKIVRLNTGSMTPAYIRDILPRLPVRPDMEYRFFMRAAPAETRSLEYAARQFGNDVPDCTLGFGIEFPSDRMWDYLNKGTRMEEVIETLETCMDIGFKVNANMILGWNNLVEADLKDLEMFMDACKGTTVTSLQLRWLFAHPHTPIYKDYDGREESIRLGPFDCGFNVKLNEEQQALNRAAALIIRNKCQEKGIRLEGFKNLAKGNLGESE